MFGWSKKHEEERKQEELCKICKHLDRVNIDVCKDLCVFCFQKYFIEKKPFPNKSKCEMRCSEHCG
jgi:hypothetical protein